MRTVVTAIIVFGLVSALRAQDDGSTRTTENDLQQILSEAGRPPPPPTFGPDDAAELERLNGQLSALRRKLLAPGADPSPEEIRRMGKESGKLTPRVRELIQRRTHWNRYKSDPDADWTQEPKPPELVPANAADRPDEVPVLVSSDAAAPSWRAFCKMLLRYENARLQLPNPPSEATWAQLARDFGRVAKARITLGAGSSWEPVVLRAMLLQGLSTLNVSVAQLNDGNVPQATASWEEGCAILHRLDTILKAVQRLEGSLDAFDRLLPFDSDLIASLNLNPSPSGLAYQIDMNWIGGEGSHASNLGTSDMARANLAQYCPWGVPVWSYLKRAGMTAGFDLRILRPYSGQNWEKMWATGIGSTAIPANVRQHLEELETGTFVHRGRLFNLNWEAIQGSGTCSVWFPSPLIREMTAGDVLGTLSSALTYIKLGLVSTALEFGSWVLGAALDQASPESWPIQIGLGVASEADAWQFDEFMQVEPNALSGVSLVKGALLKVLEKFESLEMESLFEGLNPRDDTLQSQLGYQYTYDGSWMPPVILRASVIGFEQVPDYEYRRMWSFTRYWALDPRGLTGDASPWDLSTLAVDSTPGASAVLGGNLEAAGKTWWPVPETNQGWGSQARIAGLGPELQIVDVNIDPGLVAKWKEACPDDQGLVGVIRYPHPPGYRSEMSSPERDGQTLRFAFRRQETVWQAQRNGPDKPMPRRLLTRYQLDIMRAPHRTGGDRAADTYNAFDIDAHQAVKLAEIPIRFTSQAGLPFTGKIEHPSETSVQMTVDYTGESERVFDLEPEGGSWTILPTIFRVYEGHAIANYDSEFSFSGHLGPTDLGWHTMRLKVEHPSLPRPQEFVIHDRVEHTGGAAVFMAEIPVNPGTSILTCQVPGFPPESITVERAQPSSYEPVDHQDWQGRLQYRIEQFREARTTEDRDREQLYWVNTKVYYAEACIEGLEYARARNLLREEIPNEWPNLQRLQQAGKQQDVQDFLLKYFGILADLCFRQGDGEGLAEARTNHMHLEKQEVDQLVREGYDAVEYYGRLAKDWAIYINQLILLDADPALIARLHADWLGIRRMINPNTESVDHRRFRYLQENY